MFGVATNLPAFGGALLYPPYAVLVTALLLSPPRYWWYFLLASAVAHHLAGIGTWSLNRIVFAEATNWIRALIAVIGLRRFARRPLFSSLEGLAVFFIFAVFAAPIVSAFLGAATVVLDQGDTFLHVWEAWFLANALTALTFLPPILIGATASPSPLRRRPSARRVLEGTVLAVAMAAVSILAITDVASRFLAPPERFVAPLPLLIWATVRFGPAGTSLSLLLMSVIAMVSTSRGVGPFVGASPAANMLSLHGFLAMVSIPLTMLATLVRERERVTEALHASRERYRLASTAGVVGVWDWTLETNELYIDQPIRGVLGFREEDIGTDVESWQRLVHPEDAAHITAQAAQLLDGKTPSFEAEFRMMCRDGRWRWFLTRGATVLGSEGALRGLIGTIIDITDRKSAEQSLRESEERTLIAATAGNLGFWQRDLRTGTMWLSEHARRIYGLPADSVPMREDMYALKHPEDRERIRAIIDKAVGEREGFEVEFRLVRPNGEVRWISLQGHMRFDQKGDQSYLGGVVVDVTERKQLALAAEEQQKELAHLGRVAMVGELSTALAHELNQPLTAILSNAQAAKRLLAFEPADIDQVREILDDIVRDDARAAEVIRQLRLLIQKADSLFVPLRVSDLVVEALSIVRSELLTRSVSVATDFAPDLPNVTGDRVQLLQVLLNLILNACDAMQDTAFNDRRLSITAHVDDRSRVVISVADHGTGIPKGQLEKVFEAFVTTKSGGLGLGLAICRSIVSAHEGHLWAVNNADGGAIFHLALPTRDATARDGAYQMQLHADVATST